MMLKVAMQQAILHSTVELICAFLWHWKLYNSLVLVTLLAASCLSCQPSAPDPALCLAALCKTLMLVVPLNLPTDINQLDHTVSLCCKWMFWRQTYQCRRSSLLSPCLASREACQRQSLCFRVSCFHALVPVTLVLEQFVISENTKPKKGGLGVAIAHSQLQVEEWSMHAFNAL